MSKYGSKVWVADRPFYWTDPVGSPGQFQPVERVTNGIYSIELYWQTNRNGTRTPRVSVETPWGTNGNGSIGAQTKHYKALLFDWMPFPKYAYEKAWQLCRKHFAEYIAKEQDEHDRRVAAAQQVVRRFDGERANVQHPEASCRFCRAGEGQIHNYEPEV